MLATSCEELTHWRRPWCWEGLGAGGEGDDRGWDGWMTSMTWCAWVWVNSGSWWWTGRPGVLWFMGSQRVGHDWATELTKWTEVGHSFSFKEQVSFNFMAAVTICSDFGSQENKVSHCFPIYLPWSDGTRCHDLSFFEYWVLSHFFHSPLSLSSRGSLVFAFSSKGGVIGISEVIGISPACASYSLGFRMMNSADTLKKHGDNI